MKEVNISDKVKYLKEHYPFVNIPKLTDKKKCIHCDEVIVVGEYKVFEEFDGTQYICCPNTPECDGTLIDWMPIE